MVVTKDTIIGDCLGCAMASGETIEEACIVHGMDCDALIEELNNYLQTVG